MWILKTPECFSLGIRGKLTKIVHILPQKEKTLKYLCSKYLSVHSTKPNLTILELSSIINPFSSNHFCSKLATYNRFHC